MGFEEFRNTDVFSELFKEFTMAGTEKEVFLAMKHFFEEAKTFIKKDKEDDGK